MSGSTYEKWWYNLLRAPFNPRLIRVSTEAKKIQIIEYLITIPRNVRDTPKEYIDIDNPMSPAIMMGLRPM